MHIDYNSILSSGEWKMTYYDYIVIVGFLFGIALVSAVCLRYYYGRDMI